MNVESPSFIDVEENVFDGLPILRGSITPTDLLGVEAHHRDLVAAFIRETPCSKIQTKITKVTNELEGNSHRTF